MVDLILMDDDFQKGVMVLVKLETDFLNTNTFSQREFFLMHDLKFNHSQGGLVFSNEDELKKALSLLWEKKFAGWSSYGSQMRELEICTEEEFVSALENEMKKTQGFVVGKG